MLKGFVIKNPKKWGGYPYLLYMCHFDSKETIDNGYFIPKNFQIIDVIVFNIGSLPKYSKYNFYIQKNVMSGVSRFIILYNDEEAIRDYSSQNKEMIEIINFCRSNNVVMDKEIEMKIDGVSIKPFTVSDLCTKTFILKDIMMSINKKLKETIKNSLNEILHQANNKNKSISESLNKTLTLLYKYGDKNIPKNIIESKKDQLLQLNIDVVTYSLENKDFLDTIIKNIFKINIINKLQGKDKCDGKQT